MTSTTTPTLQTIPAPVVPQSLVASTQQQQQQQQSLDNRVHVEAPSQFELSTSPPKTKIKDDIEIHLHNASTEERRSSLQRRSISESNSKSSPTHNGNAITTGSSITNINRPNSRTNSSALNHIIYPLLAEVSFIFLKGQA